MHNGMEDEIAEKEFDREFARGKKVKARVDLKGSILSVRMDSALLYRLEDYASAKGIGITTAARELIDGGLQLDANRQEGLADVLVRVAEKLREVDVLPETEQKARTTRERAERQRSKGRA